MPKLVLTLVSLLLFYPPAFAASSEASEMPVRIWQGIPGLERTAKGRIFVSWFSGGTREPEEENTVLLCYSDDDGKTCTPPAVMGAPRDGSRCFDPTPWIDPRGRLWYIFNRGNKVTGQHGVYARICEEPARRRRFSAQNFAWVSPARIRSA